MNLDTGELKRRLSYGVRRIGKMTLGAVAPAMGERLRRRYWKYRMRGVDEVLAIAQKKGDLRVLSGPFEGMRLASVYSGSSLLPKIVGSYEDELAAVVGAIVHGSYDCIVDIGSAEGYYAVGLSLLCPKARIVAYDINEAARKNLRELADLNDVADRIEIRAECSHASLAADIRGRSFVICDIEGAERELIDPARCPELASCEMLIELHTQGARDTPELVKSRFAHTHEVRSFFSRAKRVEDYPCIEFLPPHLRSVALDEMRIPGQEWIWLVPTTHP